MLLLLIYTPDFRDERPRATNIVPFSQSDPGKQLSWRYREQPRRRPRDSAEQRDTRDATPEEEFDDGLDNSGASGDVSHRSRPRSPSRSGPSGDVSRRSRPRSLTRSGPPHSPTADPSQGKRTHTDSQSRSPEPTGRKARKIRESDSARGKMSDYEPAARKISAYAIKLYTGRVSSEDGYPDKMTELIWAKQAWNDACEHMGISMAYNHEIIKLVGHDTCLTIDS